LPLVNCWQYIPETIFKCFALLRQHSSKCCTISWSLDQILEFFIWRSKYLTDQESQPAQGDVWRDFALENLWSFMLYILQGKNYSYLDFGLKRWGLHSFRVHPKVISLDNSCAFTCSMISWGCGAFYMCFCI
jgi:hypothetical protein